jgi:lipoyl(octanoyl) transferase
MRLDVLPSRTAGAAENMASDFLLLQRYPDATAARFRHYGWRSPAFTFGYSQKISFVRGQLPPGESFDLCRRPTGGGVVDHRDDWTYSLVIPRGHALEDMRATQSYRAVHEALAHALRDFGVDVALQASAPAEDTEAGPAGVCFERAEIFDVVNAVTRQKIAGGAQKRNKRGLLFQGSVWKPACAKPGLDWDAFEPAFTARLAEALGVPAHPCPWPEFAEGELEALVEQYGTPEWMEFR